ncbi:hypothetical protein HDU91_002784, partial [Kappamyces sp. JEL0680]
AAPTTAHESHIAGFLPKHSRAIHKRSGPSWLLSGRQCPAYSQPAGLSKSSTACPGIYGTIYHGSKARSDA